MNSNPAMSRTTFADRLSGVDLMIGLNAGGA